MSSRVGRGRIKQLTSGVNPLVRFIHEHNAMGYDLKPVRREAQ